MGSGPWAASGGRQSVYQPRHQKLDTDTAAGDTTEWCHERGHGRHPCGSVVIPRVMFFAMEHDFFCLSFS